MAGGPSSEAEDTSEKQLNKRQANKLATRKRLLDAATHLFAEHGYPHVSVRQIAERAKVNSALVNYHFESKENLLVEAVRSSTERHMSNRIDRLNQALADAGGAPLETELLLKIYLEPVLLSPRWEQSGYLEARLHSTFMDISPEFSESVANRVFNPVNDIFVRELLRGLPHLDRITVIWRLYAIIGSIMFFNTRPAPPGMKSLSENQCDPAIGKEVLRQLLPYAVAALQAPAP